MLKTLLFEEIESIEQDLDDYVISQIKTKNLTRFECHEDINLMTFDYIDIEKGLLAPAKIIIYFSKTELLFLCENETILNLAKNIVKEKETLDKSLYYFFSSLIDNDEEKLDEIEEKIAIMEDELLQTTKNSYSSKIRTFRKHLLEIKCYYEHLDKIFDGLRDNENELIKAENLRYFKILHDRAEKLYSHVLTLRDYVTQVREAYQAQIDIEQNNIMRIFTVFTVIFLPLTLIVGWYGMNVKMPEFEWSFGYPLVIALSVISIIVCIIIFKKKKWF